VGGIKECSVCKTKLIADETANRSQVKPGVVNPLCYTCAEKKRVLNENKKLSAMVKKNTKK